jgi:phosphinothricin acetyltransferase
VFIENAIKLNMDTQFSGQKQIFRYGNLSDLPSIIDIYNYYVENAHATFAENRVTFEERKAWLSKYQNSGPYRLLVAEEAGKVFGFICSSQYRDHPAFRETIETSIYLSPDARGKGLGTRLYLELFDRLKDEPIHLAVVGIGLPNDASIELHKKLGFTEVGVFKEYAKVRGIYYSSIWMQKTLSKTSV